MPNYVANFEGLFVGVLRKDSCKVITFAIITTAVVGCRVTVVIAVFMDSCGVLGVRFPSIRLCGECAINLYSLFVR